jgi:hypothetical protein
LASAAIIAASKLSQASLVAIRHDSKYFVTEIGFNLTWLSNGVGSCERLKLVLDAIEKTNVGAAADFILACRLVRDDPRSLSEAAVYVSQAFV